MKTKLKTIDDDCGLPQGSFAEFVKAKEQFLSDIESERKARIKAFREGIQLPTSALTLRGRAVFFMI